LSKTRIIVEAIPYDTKVTPEDMNKIIKTMEPLKHDFDFEFKFNLKY